MNTTLKQQAPEPTAVAGQHASLPYLPPHNPQETGLPFVFLVDLTLKTLFHAGRMRLWALGESLKLPVAVIEPLVDFLRTEGLCEVARRDPDAPSADIGFQLSGAGRARAMAALEKSQYVGPAPVSLTDYVAQVECQNLAQGRVSRQALDAAFAGIVTHAGITNDLGAALNSGRALLVYGPSGSGKTFIAEHLATALNGLIHVPHAILVDNDVIQVFDPLVHLPPAAATHDGAAGPWSAADARWVQCRRPVVMTGGELTLSMLDLQFDSHSRFYVAPPQVKANNGLFIIDDLGRQLVTPHDLMNRWIVPLDRRVDHFVLHTGKKFRLPFHVHVVFSSNLTPADLSDDAFLRRLGYKVYVGAVDAGEYRALFKQACERADVPHDEAACDYLLSQLHEPEDKPLLACTPFDIVSMVRDRAVYLDEPARLGEKALTWAWRTYFAAA